MPKRGRHKGPQLAPERKRHRIAGGLIYWTLVLIWLACILYPWIGRWLRD